MTTLNTIQSIIVDSNFETATITDSTGIETIETFLADSTLIDKCDRLESIINTDSTSFELDTDTLNLLDSTTSVIVLNSMLKSGIEAVRNLVATAKKTGTSKKPSSIKTFDSMMNRIVNLGINSDTQIDSTSILSIKKALSWYKSNNCTNKKDKPVKGTEKELAYRYFNHVSTINGNTIVDRIESVLTQLLESVKNDKFIQSMNESLVSESQIATDAIETILDTDAIDSYCEVSE